MGRFIFRLAGALALVFAGAVALLAREVNHAPLSPDYYLAYRFFISSTLRFSVVRLDSHQPQPQPQSGIVVLLSACAPNGNYLAVLADQLYVLSADDQQRAALPFEGALLDQITVSNTGEAVVSMARLQYSPPTYLLYRADFAAHRLTELPMQGSAVLRAPALAPDGQRIAMTMSSLQNPPQTGVIVADMRSAVPTVAEAWSPAWSPEGDMIAFIRQIDDNYQVFIKDMRTLAEMQVTRDEIAKRWPVWSPDGRHLLYVRSRGSQSEVYVVNWDSSVREQFSLPESRTTRNFSLEGACFLTFQPNLLDAVTS